ncbi:TetR/AcrR family transcriptional regulator [Mucilaginibacter psychrotolerans]|uniref:TetR/AcrR family transcriptional regulator n=1 Tax=Mucilaginibacter psychrotolerans TaxID=1524096 RepID=A0A4Y8S5F7_9SPHI|nr:TetR/AcrR family transcriptional regulator [Mucilaginibacter psychrotolerans]TFF34198.1 TetR/AcrR family transcriptional regulator [Mucilaginibacter psychrotolerans]
MTKEEIVESSLQQFLLRGIREMTVQQIINPLGISTKTVYKYFSGKEDLLEACLILHYQNLKVSFNKFTAAAMDPITRLSSILYKGIEEDFKAAPEFYHDLNYYYPKLQDKIMAKEMASYGRYLIQTMEEGVEQQLFRADTNPLVFMETIDILYRSLTRSTHFQKHQLSPFQLAANTITIYLRGACTATGVAILDNLKQPS